MNPIISTVYSPDPSAHVWDDKGVLWVYGSNDAPGTNTHDTMSSYHVFSTKDMVNWTDYGCVLHLDNVKWAISNMWAIDAAYRNGTYYLIFCAIETATGMFRTGVATSKNPQGPFHDQGFIKGVERGQDPALFIDTDNTPYLFWGLEGNCYGCQLTDDLMEAVPDTTVTLTQQLNGIYEGPFVHMYNGKYYLTYPGLKSTSPFIEEMRYAIADRPLGPYKYMGAYIPAFEGRAGSNHGSVVEFKGKWYAFHHSAWKSGISESRSMMCDYLHYDNEGKISPIIPDKKGVHSTEDDNMYETKVTVWLDASAAPIMKGKLSGTRVGTEIKGYTGDGYVEGFSGNYFGLSVMAQSAIEYDCYLKVRYCAPDGACTKKIILNDVAIQPSHEKQDTYEKLHNFKQCDTWETITVAKVKLKVGENYLRFYNGTGEIKLDAILFEQA